MSININSTLMETRPDVQNTFLYSLDTIVREAIRRELISPSIPESVHSEKLARKLISNPTKVANIENLRRYLTKGIQSGLCRGSSLRVTEIATGHENKVHFTFGIPYIFNNYAPRGIQKLPKNFIVVFDGDKILDRPDLHIPFIDSGVIFKEYNLFSEGIKDILKKHPEYHKTDFDPTYLLYSHITSNPSYLSQFKEQMLPIYEQFCLSREDLPIYMSLLLASCFPYKDLSRGKMPEGNVDSEITLDYVKWIILNHDDYVQAYEPCPSHQDILVDAGPNVELGASMALLTKYADLIGAKTEFNEYISKNH